MIVKFYIKGHLKIDYIRFRHKTIAFLGRTRYNYNQVMIVENLSQKLRKYILHIFFPTVCPYCERVIYPDEYACEQCRKKLPDKSLTKYARGGYLCSAPLPYDEPYSTAVKTFKFRNMGSYAPIQGLTVTEVIALGDWLGLPQHLTHKTPVDGLQPKTDEEKLGFKYADLDRYIREDIGSPEFKAKVDDLYRRNKFKTDIVQIPHPNFDYLGNFVRYNNLPDVRTSKETR